MKDQDQGVTAVVLAAGRSSRMGRPKGLLPTGRLDETFVTRLVTTSRRAGLTEVIVVVRADDTAMAAEAKRAAARVRVVLNPDADEGQLSSVQAAIRVVRPTSALGVLVVPVDMPLVTAETVRALTTAFIASPARIVRAVHAGRHGHPVIFPRSLFDELLCADPSLGARAVVRAHGALDVQVDDIGTVEDVDTPEDYDRLFPPDDGASRRRRRARSDHGEAEER